MPSGYLHKRCAEQACALSGVTPAPHGALIFGAQGPDPLFLLGMFPLRPSGKPLLYGHTLHMARTGAFLRALLATARGRGAAERAYAMGFLTHYALDSTVHPYVYAHSATKKGRYSSSTHMRLEKRWDSLYYRRDGYRGTSVTMPGVLESKADWPKIAALVAEACRAVYPDMNLTEAMLLTAYRDSVRANRLSHSPSGVKYALVWLLERLIGKPRLATSHMAPRFLSQKDIENRAHLPWHAGANPGVARREGLDELFEAAVRRAAELLAAANQFYDGALDEAALHAVIGNVGYDTGMESRP